MVEMLFNNKFQRILVLIGCVIFQMKSSSHLQRSKIEKVSIGGQDWAEDVWAFCRRKRRSYTKVLEPYITRTPTWRDAFAMKWWQNHKLPPPTHPTKDNVHLGTFSNVRFSLKFCRWALHRKTWRDSCELWSKIIVFSDNELPHWLSMKSQESLDDDHYKHLLFGSYAGMLGDPNYIQS